MVTIFHVVLQTTPITYCKLQLTIFSPNSRIPGVIRDVFSLLFFHLLISYFFRTLKDIVIIFMRNSCYPTLIFFSVINKINTQDLTVFLTGDHELT